MRGDGTRAFSLFQTYEERILLKLESASVLSAVLLVHYAVNFGKHNDNQHPCCL